MMSDQVRQVENAARFLTRILTGFTESSVYEAFKDVEHFTDEEYEDAIDTLTEFGSGSGVVERTRQWYDERPSDGSEE